MVLEMNRIQSQCGPDDDGFSRSESDFSMAMRRLADYRFAERAQPDFNFRRSLYDYF